MKILSFGAGMQSTALALMSCENAFAKTDGKELPYPLVPIYDIVIFCDLGLEPVWVRKQADFVRRACETAGIRYKELDAPLYQDLMRDFGKKRVVSIPWWTIDEKGHKSKFPRNCTLDYKVQVISKYVRWDLDTESTSGCAMRIRKLTRCTWGLALKKRNAAKKARIQCS